MRIAKPKPTYVGDAKVRTLLEAYACPVPLHAVKARFMGTIASPKVGASPLRTIEDLWPGGLPTFESTDEADRLMQALMSLWNHLARHQKHTKPFRFARASKLAGREQMTTWIHMRCEEIENFLKGLFNGEERFDVSEEIAAELDTLEEVYGLLSKFRDRLTDEAIWETDKDIIDLFKIVRDLERIAEMQINEVIQACVAWRRAATSSQDVQRRSLH